MLLSPPLPLQWHPQPTHQMPSSGCSSLTLLRPLTLRGTSRTRLPAPCCRRLLRRLTMDDAAAASHIFTVLMGDKVAPRRALIEEEGARFVMDADSGW
jgi:hypothetical protein